MKITRTRIISWIYCIADLFRIARLLTIARILNWLILEGSYWFSRITGKLVHKGLPAAFSIETSSLCNLRCPECIIGSGQISRPTGIMNFQLFQSIIKQTKKHTLWLQLNFQGEPFLNPYLPEMVALATQNKLYVSLSTNGHFLSAKIAKDLIDAGLSRIIISVDGTDQKTYEIYRTNGNLNQVTEGIENLVKFRKQKKVTHPLIIIQFLVFKHNFDQIQQVKKLAANLETDLLIFKLPQILPSHHSHKVFPAKGKWSRYEPDEKKTARLCHRMWTSPVVTWDGRLLPCCFDKNASFCFGNLNNSSLNILWKGNTAKEFRLNVSNKERKITICQNCPE